MTVLRRGLSIVAAVGLLHACSTLPVGDGPPDDPPPLEEILAIPEPVPRFEPRSPYGNPDSYEVFGRRYHVLDGADGFRERGRASWYGRKFHGRRTSSGEPYDMYALTAAHKTLPLPAYVRVTHLASGRSLIVRVNDRGPFHDGRIIDLSYAAAVRLGILGAGEAEVDIAVITPGEPAPEAPPPAIEPPTQYAEATALPAPPAPESWLDAGMFDDPINAVALREQIAALGVEAVEIRIEDTGDVYRHRVLVGPFADAGAAAIARDRLLADRISTELFSP